MTTLQKVGGVLLGAVALFGALMLVNYIRQRRAESASLSGAAAQEGVEGSQDVVAAEQAAKGAGLPSAPCEVAGVPGTMPAVQEWFPGSYVPFSLTNAGCLDDPRNKRC